MPIDARIPLGVQTPQNPSPLELYSHILQIQNQRESLGALAAERQAQTQLLQQRAAENEYTRRGRDALIQAIKNAQTTDPVTGEIYTDHAKVIADPGLLQFPERTEAWSKMTTNNAEALEKLENTRRNHGQQVIDAIGTLIPTIQSRQDFDTALGVLASPQYHAITGQDALRIANQADEMGPDGWRALLTQYEPLTTEAKKRREEIGKVREVARGAKVVIPAQPGVPGSQEIVLARGEPEKPGTLEEQYLEAVSRGDKVTAQRILGTMQATANAKRDPAAQALAAELGALRANEARERLDKMRREALPLDVTPDVITTRSGKSYIDLSTYTGEERNKARTAAAAAGVMPVSKQEAQTLREIDTARANQDAILNGIQDKLPAGVLGRGVAAVSVPLSKFFQSDADIASFNTWRTAAIQALRATAGSAGLRINAAEIAQAVENDIPKLTDTVATAQAKMQKIKTLLQNSEDSILVRDRRPVTPPPPPPPPPEPPGIQSLRKR